MKVAVIGAHGDVGEHVIKKLKEKNYESLAVIGSQEQSDATIKRGASHFAIYNEETMDSLFTGYDAVIFLNGVSPSAHTSKTVLLDHDAIHGSIEEAKNQGVKRFIMLSAIRANEIPEAKTSNIAERESADEKLKNSSLTFTIVRSGRLTNTPGSGKISISETLEDPQAEISRDDLAAILVESLETDATFNKIFEVSSGDTPIHDALGSV